MPQLSPAEIGSTTRIAPAADSMARRTVSGSSFHAVRWRVLRMTWVAGAVETVMPAPSR